MKLNSLLKCSLAAALLGSQLLAATVVSAQPAAKPAASNKSPYQLEIEGGILLLPTGNKVEATLENVAEQLRELELLRHGDPANIVLSPDLPKIKIANLKLAATTLAQELEALRVASGERFVWSPGDYAVPVLQAATGLYINQSPDQMQGTLYILRPAAESGRDRLRVEAFSLTGYFESRKKGNDEKAYEQMVHREIEQIEIIVAETAALYRDLNQKVSGGEMPGGKAPSLRFHSGANLLVVMGDPGAVELAAKVISALPHVQPSDGSAGGAGFGGRYGTPPTDNPYSPSSRR